MRSLLLVTSVLPLLSPAIGPAGAAECGQRAPNGAIAGTLAGGDAPCRPAANARAPIGQKAPPSAVRRQQEPGNTQLYIGGSVGTQTWIGGR